MTIFDESIHFIDRPDTHKAGHYRAACGKKSVDEEHVTMYIERVTCKRCKSKLEDKRGKVSAVW